MKKNKYFSGIINYIVRTDKLLWLVVFAMSIYSLLLLKSVSRASTSANYLNTQIYAIIIGFVGAVIISLIDYENYIRFWYLLAGFSVFIMLYTIFFGNSVVGSAGVEANAWIFIGGRSIQPSEFVKLAFIITFAKQLDYNQKSGKTNDPLSVILLLAHALVPFLLCHMQGDDGTGLVFIVIFLFMSLSAGVSLKYFGILLAALLISLPIIWNFILRPYQKSRFRALFDLDGTMADEGYQQWNGRLSIGSGGLSGSGLFKGSRVASNSVAFQENDFIFSVAGEELGFVGCMLIIFLLVFCMVKILFVARNARDDVGKYICFGYFGIIALHSIANIGMCLALLPVMGVPLPFFSAGGSSMMALYLGVGLVQSVHMRKKESDGVRLNRKTPMRFTYSQIKNL